MSEFYMTLPSNASAATFPNNTLTHYLVKLERPLRLQGKWKVALVEMQYTNSWDNVTDGRIIINQKPVNSTKVMFVKSGRYRTIEELIDGIKDALASFQIDQSIQLVRDRIQNTCSIQVEERDLEIKFSKNVSNILGLEHRYYTYGYTKGVSQCDLSEGFASLYVYSNIVEPQIVGDVQVPLLRIVPVRERSKLHNQVESFQHLQYLPVKNDNAETVEIDIRRDDGSAVSFQSGKVVVTLHFKAD